MKKSLFLSLSTPIIIILVNIIFEYLTKMASYNNNIYQFVSLISHGFKPTIIAIVVNTISILNFLNNK